MSISSWSGGRGLALAAVPWVAWLTLAPAPSPTSEEWIVIVSGDADGYLSPCGCVQPMSGGIRRRGTAVNALSRPGRTVFVDNGSLAGGLGRQNEIKAETFAESLGKLGVTAINLAPADAQLGPGVVSAIDRLSGGALVSTSLQPSDSLEVRPFARRGPFLIGGASASGDAVAAPLGEQAFTPEQAARRLVEAARNERATPILLLSGDLNLARRLARAEPSLALVAYRSTSSPARAPLTEGRTWLVTPGDRGKSLVRIEWAGSSWRGYGVADLGPDFEDDPALARLYAAYQGRVRRERLLEKLPREPGSPFAGSAACASCHPSAYAIWEKTEHAQALKTLEDDGHDRDPDCTGCHVVGLDRTTGFRSRDQTPYLADVGCESCHGPGKAHANHALANRMPKVGERSCLPCHNADHSPKFDYGPYWDRIKHGLEPKSAVDPHAAAR